MQNAFIAHTLSRTRVDRAPRRTRHGRHAMLAIVGLVAVFGIGFAVLGIQHWSGSRTTLRSSETEIRTGTIRLAPNVDWSCQQYQFDNRTGRFRSDGEVNCSGRVVTQTSAEPGTVTESHLVRVRESFRNR